MYSNSTSEAEDNDRESQGRRQVTRRVLNEANSASVDIVEAVAAATGRDVCDLPLLYEQVDPDALDALFAPKPDGTPRLAGEVRFSLAGCDVTVTGEGEIVVRGSATPPELDSTSTT